jgi:hypothetical protein
MDYKKIYNDLIQDAITNPKMDSYKEYHHIIPRCIGGNNDKSNLVKLTARQHFIAHWLLFKIHKTSKLANAWYNMLRIGAGQDERRINSRMFEICKRERNKILSKKMTGSGNHFYNKHHTPETKQKLSFAHKGKDYRSKKTINDWICNVAKQQKSKTHRGKIGAGSKGFIVLQNIITKEIIRCKKTDELLYDNLLWINPRKITPETKFKCDHCDMVTTKSNLTRWHNEKCKRKKCE